MIDVYTVEDLQKDWRDQYRQWWAAGMPAFYTADVTPFKKIEVKFPTREDRDEFSRLLNAKLTDRTDFIFFPLKSQEQNMKSRYTEE